MQIKKSRYKIVNLLYTKNNMRQKFFKKNK